MADPKPAYLLQGDDEVKIDGWRSRVRQRALDDPEATLEVFPDAGHFPSIEQPDRFNEVLLPFVGQWQT